MYTLHPKGSARLSPALPLAAEAGGHVLRGRAVQVQVELLRAFDRGPRLWERLSGPHRTEVTLGAGRAWTPAVPPPYDAGSGPTASPTAAPTLAATAIRST